MKDSLESTHNSRFVALMEHFLLNWKVHRQVMNRLPVRHEESVNAGTPSRRVLR